jgi:hypothetical protein
MDEHSESQKIGCAGLGMTFLAILFVICVIVGLIIGLPIKIIQLFF